MVGGTVTVLIPSIPTRGRMLNRAFVSVLNQMRQADAIIVSLDHDRLGAAGNRNRALEGVTTEWVAFLDDDDEFQPEHLLVLLQNSDDADVIYTGCTVIGPQGQEIPLKEEWGRFGEPFDAGLLRKKSYLPVTCLARTELLHQWERPFEAPAGTDYDDWGMYLKLLGKGARFKHVAQKTWIWFHTGFNTSGRSDRW
jgi:Glycosyl transferase family 2